jgi:ribosomal protein S3AE
MAVEKSQLKVKKKIWAPVLSCKSLGSIPIGEIPITDANLIQGRHIKANMMNLTGNPKNQNINIDFRIENVMGSKGIAYPVSYSMISSTIKRLVRRKKDKVEDSFICTTADGIRIRVKPLLITRSQAANSVLTAIRKAAKDFLTASASGSNYITFFMDIVHNRVQKVLRDNIKKIYPIAVCEIRVLEALHDQDLSKSSDDEKRADELADKRLPEAMPAGDSQEQVQEPQQESSGQESTQAEEQQEASGEETSQPREESAKPGKPSKAKQARAGSDAAEEQAEN